MLQFSKGNNLVILVTLFVNPSRVSPGFYFIRSDQHEALNLLFSKEGVEISIVRFPATLKGNRTSNHKQAAAESELLTIFQNNCHTLVQATDPSLVLVQASYWLNTHRRRRHRRRDSGA